MSLGRDWRLEKITSSWLVGVTMKCKYANDIVTFVILCYHSSLFEFDCWSFPRWLRRSQSFRLGTGRRGRSQEGLAGHPAAGASQQQPWNSQWTVSPPSVIPFQEETSSICDSQFHSVLLHWAPWQVDEKKISTEELIKQVKPMGDGWNQVDMGGYWYFGGYPLVACAGEASPGYSLGRWLLPLVQLRWRERLHVPHPGVILWAKSVSCQFIVQVDRFLLNSWTLHTDC